MEVSSAGVGAAHPHRSYVLGELHTEALDGLDNKGSLEAGAQRGGHASLEMQERVATATSRSFRHVVSRLDAFLLLLQPDRTWVQSLAPPPPQG